MKIERLDHLVLTVRDVDETIEFYTRVLGMQAITFGENRRALGAITSAYFRDVDGNLIEGSSYALEVHAES